MFWMPRLDLWIDARAWWTINLADLYGPGEQSLALIGAFRYAPVIAWLFYPATWLTWEQLDRRLPRAEPRRALAADRPPRAAVPRRLPARPPRARQRERPPVHRARDLGRAAAGRRPARGLGVRAVHEGHARASASSGSSPGASGGISRSRSAPPAAIALFGVVARARACGPSGSARSSIASNVPPPPGVPPLIVRLPDRRRHRLVRGPHRPRLAGPGRGVHRPARSGGSRARRSSPPASRCTGSASASGPELARDRCRRPAPQRSRSFAPPSRRDAPDGLAAGQPRRLRQHGAAEPVAEGPRVRRRPRTRRRSSSRSGTTRSRRRPGRTSIAAAARRAGERIRAGDPTAPVPRCGSQPRSSAPPRASPSRTCTSSATRSTTRGRTTTPPRGSTPAGAVPARASTRARTGSTSTRRCWRCSCGRWRCSRTSGSP